MPVLRPARFRACALPLFLLVMAAPAVRAQGVTATPAAATAATLPPPAPLALANDNRVPAGTRRGRVVTATLELVAVRWRPSGDSLLEFPMLAFAEPGRAPQIPGPLLRARVGDTLRLTVRNPTARTLLVVGLADRGRQGAPNDTLRVAPGAAHELAIRLTTAGTFWYDAITRHEADSVRKSPYPDKPNRPDHTLVGAFVVDPADAPADAASRDRILVIHSGFDPLVLEREARRRARLPYGRLHINGASWPATERLEYTVGDTVRWRVINTVFLPHPVHLHGFYFRVDGRGDFTRDTTFTRLERRMGVTELLESYSTARLTWVPDRPGNWLFHCHLLMHMAPAHGYLADAADAHGAHGAAMAHDPGDHMSGMVMGIHVRARAGAHAVSRRADDAPPRRRLALWAQSRDSALAGGMRGFGFVLAEGAPPRPDSIRRPGATITLVRGEPVAIVVHNRLAKPLAVHWHGMEIESRYDGVGGWSGMPGSVTPAIAPGDSLVVHLTPRRAGTFIYHTHDESDNELDAGLYGALLVLEPGTRRDPARDHVVILASGADGRMGPLNRSIARHVPVVDGDTLPRPLLLAPGRNRVRLIQISDSDVKDVRLVDAAGTVLDWRVLAKDGWTRPPMQQRPRPATLGIGVGETYDVELDAAAIAAHAPVWLEIVTRYYPGYKDVAVHRARMAVVVAGGR